MDKQAIIKAMQIIIARGGSSAANNAIKTIQAANANSPILQQRVNLTVSDALNNPQNDLRDDDVVILASIVGAAADDGGTISKSIRFTEAEIAKIEMAIDGTGENFSQYVRRKALS